LRALERATGDLAMDDVRASSPMAAAAERINRKWKGLSAGRADTGPWVNQME
jgi:hypothetical protein